MEWNKAKEQLEEMEKTLAALPQLAAEDLTGRTAVFTVDMNHGFAVSGALASPRTAARIPDTVSFLTRCREAGVDLYAITDTHPSDCLEFGAYPPHCVEGTAECEVVPQLAALVKEIFPKNSTNALFAPGILDCCRQYDRIIITGCCTDICIHQFAVGLKAWANQQNRPLDVVVPVSLCDTFDAPGHDAGLMNLIFFQSMAAGGVRLVR